VATWTFRTPATCRTVGRTTALRVNPTGPSGAARYDALLSRTTEDWAQATRVAAIRMAAEILMAPGRRPVTDVEHRLEHMVHPLKLSLQWRVEPWLERDRPTIDRRISCWCDIWATRLRQSRLNDFLLTKKCLITEEDWAPTVSSFFLRRLHLEDL